MTETDGGQSVGRLQVCSAGNAPTVRIALFAREKFHVPHVSMPLHPYMEKPVGLSDVVAREHGLSDGLRELLPNAFW